MVSDQAIGLTGRVLSGTPRDTLHFVDLVYDPHGGPRPEVLITDAGSYSDLIFGIVTLLGFDYRPVLADLPDTKLWRIDAAADYGYLDRTARGRSDLGKIARHWPDILRVVASIHTREISAHDAIRVLQRDGRLNALGEAIAHYGRIFKTLHVLTLVEDPAYRREMKRMRNLQEQRHGLGRKVFHGRKGEVYRAYHDGMEDQLGALGLVLNCVTLWNTQAALMRCTTSYIDTRGGSCCDQSPQDQNPAPRIRRCVLRCCGVPRRDAHRRGGFASSIGSVAAVIALAGGSLRALPGWGQPPGGVVQYQCRRLHVPAGR